MSKRPAEASSSTRTIDGQPFSKVQTSTSRRETDTQNEMGEFEDAWEDEVESDTEVADGGENDEDGSGKKSFSL